MEDIIARKEEIKKLRDQLAELKYQQEKALRTLGYVKPWNNYDSWVHPDYVRQYMSDPGSVASEFVHYLG